MSWYFAAPAAGFLLDLMLGDPVYAWHPVRLMGGFIRRMEKILRKFSAGDVGKRSADGNSRRELLAGAALALCTVCLFTLPPALLLHFLKRTLPASAFCLEALWCWQLLAVKDLKKEALLVPEALSGEGLYAAREALSRIVGRDTARLSEEEVIRAAVETVAENTSDGVVAPLFYMLFFGAAGGFFYKAVNTMDSMIGYKNERYLYFGCCAARLDDLLNIIPSRCAALLMIATAWMTGFSAADAARIWKRDRRKTESPNAGQTEAACAGALGIALGGNAYYFGKLREKPVIGDALRPVERQDVKRACSLLYGTAFLAALFTFMIRGIMS